MGVGGEKRPNMAKFKMLVGRTGFNEVALGDTFIQALLQLILFKIHKESQECSTS